MIEIPRRIKTNTTRTRAVKSSMETMRGMRHFLEVVRMCEVDDTKKLKEKMHERERAVFTEELEYHLYCNFQKTQMFSTIYN